jgi:hypothetical protein
MSTLEAWKYFYGFITVVADLTYLKQYLVQPVTIEAVVRYLFV